MDSFELNKIAGAVLFALLVSFGVSIGSEMLFETHAPEAPGYMIAVAETGHGEGDGEAATAERPHIATLLASADPAAGEAAAKKCATCHTFGEGEANKVGPNLWAIVMRPIAAHPGYEYSPALTAYAAEAQTWDYDNLDAFLHSPGTTVPKTKMAFAGLKNDSERANVIAYLRTLAAEPAPMPEAPAVTAAAEPTTATDAGTGQAAAPAEGGAEAPAEAAGQQAQDPATVVAQDPATNQAQPQQQGGAAGGAEQQAAAQQPTGAEQPGESGQQGTAGGGQQVAAAPSEAAGESGTAGAVAQPQGTLGPIDTTTADQQGAVPQVPPIDQPAPDPEAVQALQQQGGQAGAAGQQAAQPAAEQPAQEAAQPAAEQPAQVAAPAEQTAPAAQPAQPAAEQQVAQADNQAQPAQGTEQAAPAQGTEQPAAAAPAAAGAASGFAALVGTADAAKGGNLAKRCAACHSFEKGGANKVGPMLWDVVNRPVASVPDFEYSEAMVAFSEGGQKLWTYDELSAFIENPKGHVPGTMMAFPGIKKEEDRANLIAYLRSLSDNPAPVQ